MRIGCLVRTVGVFLLVVCGGPQAIGQSPTEARKKSAAGQGMIYLSREEILDGAKKEGNLLV